MANWTLCERLRSEANWHLTEGEYYTVGELLTEAADRIEELERLCAAKDTLIDHLQSRVTFVAHTPPVEHHTRGSVLDYYRDIPKD